MSKYNFELTARDLLFFRDARPVSGSSIGCGGIWPLPGTLHSAVASAMHQIDGETAGMEGVHRHETDREKKTFGRKCYRLGALKTRGPFPCVKGELHFQVPADLVPLENQDEVAYLNPVQFPEEVCSNLPLPLKYGVASPAAPTKKSVGAWISISELKKYLAGCKCVKTVANSELYAAENRHGIGIDANTGTVVKGQFYVAEYLRLNPEVTMWMQLECIGRQWGGGNARDIGAVAVAKGLFDNFQMGGQRGVVYGDESSCDLNLPPFVCEGTRVKWTLLTPAIFCNGWLPNFVDKNTGAVYLREETVRNDKARKDWKGEKNQQAPIKANLVAARIARALPVSGWRSDEKHAGGHPKATRLLTPAGSVFYFECESSVEAQKLCRALHGVCKSDDADHGYGLGVCSTWNLTTF